MAAAHHVPPSTSTGEGYLEYPTEAFTDYRAAGVDRVVCEEKHMGSRAAADPLFEELNTDSLLLDCELLPWSAKAGALIKGQYATVGAAAGAAPARRAESFDTTAADRIAKQQYDRLPA